MLQHGEYKQEVGDFAGCLIILVFVYNTEPIWLHQPISAERRSNITFFHVIFHQITGKVVKIVTFVVANK